MYLCLHLEWHIFWKCFILNISYLIYVLFFWRCDPTRVIASSFLRFLDHTQRRSTVGSTLLDEWSARRRHIYLTTHYTHNRQTSVPPVGFEPTISAGERPQIYALDRAATGTGISYHIYRIIYTFTILTVHLLVIMKIIKMHGTCITIKNEIKFSCRNNSTSGMHIKDSTESVFRLLQA